MVDKQLKLSINSHTSIKHKTHYKLISEGRFHFITYQEVGTRSLFCMHVLALVKNSELINGFNSQDACQIGVIAGQACLEPLPRLLAEQL